jgi:hypothetical protein
MGFFPETSDPAVELAKRLYSQGVKYRKTSGAFPPTWARVFRTLLGRHDADKIGKILDWYVASHTSDSVPHSWHPTTFAANFDKLCLLQDMEDNASEVVSPANMGLAEQFANDLRFPVEIRAQLPLLVQRTRNNWNAFLHRAAELPHPSQREAAFLASPIHHDPIFVRTWMELLCQKFGGLEHYTRPVLLLAFKADSKLFAESLWRDWSNEWSGNPCTFDSLLSRLSRAIV